MGWHRVVAQLWNRSPACPRCGGPMSAAGEDLVHDLPPVLETRYECRRCDADVVRRDVVEIWA